jgi:sulfonate transport system ATP-binding protein
MEARTGFDRQAVGQAVSVRGLTRRFGSATVLDGLDLDIATGEFVALLGRSGSGKSTLLRALARLDHAADGEGSLDVPDDVSFVFQDSRLLPWKRVIDNVVLGVRGKDRQAIGSAILEEVGLAGRERSWPKELSGGERQRVALVRSLISRPDLLLADEPFGALDALTRLKMHALLQRLVTRYSPAVLLVTHDVDEAIKLADRVIVLDGGGITFDTRLDIDLDRSYGSADHVALRSELLALLGVAADAEGGRR